MSKQTTQSKNRQKITDISPKTCRWPKKHMKNTSLIIREMQIKTITRYYLTLVNMAIIKRSTNNKCWEGTEKKEPSYTVDGNIN